MGWTPEHAANVAEIAYGVIREMFGGGAVYVPKRNHEHKQRIIDEYKAGARICDLSRKYGVVANTVRNYVKPE